MSYLYQRRFWVYTALVALLLLDASAYFRWLQGPANVPGYNEARLTQLQREVTALEKEVARLRHVREQLPKVRPSLVNFTNDRFPLEQRGFAGVAAALNDAAHATGVKLAAVTYKVQSQSPRPDLVAVEVKADLQGGYRSLLRYLDELQQANGFYLIGELGVVSTQRGDLRLEATLVTYFRRGAA
ncbi:MAG: hypothetical protein ACRD35_01930 [Candidatus Acidiferrales bacterium]